VGASFDWAVVCLGADFSGCLEGASEVLALVVFLVAAAGCFAAGAFDSFSAAFDPLADKSSAVAVCNQVCQWIRDLESEIFLLGVTPFSW